MFALYLSKVEGIDVVLRTSLLDDRKLSFQYPSHTKMLKNLPLVTFFNRISPSRVRSHSVETKKHTLMVCSFVWQGQKGSNPRHAVLETAALPAELYPCVFTTLVLYNTISKKSIATLK